MSYIVIILAVLVLLNSYPLLVSQNLVFRSKQTSMNSSVKMIESSLSGLAQLTTENVGQALSDLRETGVSRIIVTDTAGYVLYDTRETGNAQGMYAFYTEVAQALDGNDAYFCRYDSEAFLSRCAQPVVYRNQIIGAIFAYEYDTEQARLLQSFQKNLATISVIVGVLVLLLSVLLSRLFTRQISDLLQAIRSVREGAYSRRANVRGTDEIAQIAAEFNSLTDRLQTTENARRRFVSDASHELKTPLAGIRLLTDSILQTDEMDGTTVREFVTDIGQEAERLSRITEDLLRLTRLDSDNVDRPAAVPVKPVLERVVRMLGMVAREKEVSISWEADDRAVVMTTEDDIHQILYNLMENGIKYSTRMGFVHTAVTVEGEAVVIRVEDNGIGIPEEDLTQIFERFYRVDKNRSRQVGGTGLGLAIVRDTVVRRGGTVAAHHRPAGSGTVFTVRLPLAEGGEAS
jgi:signal transduction histidine kinase